MSSTSNRDAGNFFSTAWRKLRPHALAFVVDTGLYCKIWAGVLVAHIVKVAFAAFGIDKDIVANVGFMEKWAQMGIFACYFVQLLRSAVAPVLQREET
jgi:hypothetical protein